MDGRTNTEMLSMYSGSRTYTTRLPMVFADYPWHKVYKLKSLATTWQHGVIPEFQQNATILNFLQAELCRRNQGYLTT